MRWELSEEQLSLRDSVRGWLRATSDMAQVRKWHDAHDPTPFVERLGRDGWLGLGLDEEYGGQGGGLLELCLVTEELSRHVVPSSMWYGTALARAALIDTTDHEFLTPCASPQEKPTVLGTSAEHTPDSRLPVTAENHRLTGQIGTVLGAEPGVTLIVPARDGSFIRLYAVDMAATGVKLQPRTLLDRSRTCADVFLSDAEARPLDLDAASALSRASNTAAALVAADSVGAIDAMLDMTVTHTKQRHQFGVPVGSFQAVKHGAASMLVALEAARTIAYFAAASVDAHEEEADLHAAVAKAQATSQGATAAETALTLHGAVGYTWEHDLQLLYKRSKANEFLFGHPCVWNERLAQALENQSANRSVETVPAEIRGHHKTSRVTPSADAH